MRRSMVALALCATQVGCLRTTVNFEETVQVEPSYEQRHPYFLGGLVPDERKFKASELCEDGRKLQRLETQTSALDGFLEIITLAIYSPKTLRVWCGA